MGFSAPVKQIGQGKTLSRTLAAKERERADGISAAEEASELLLPDEALGVAKFKNEILTFQSLRFLGQVDGLVQLRAGMRG